MSNSSPIERLKSSRVVQALVVYLGAAYVALQVVDLLADAVPVPTWLVPGTLVLLIVGFVIVLATSWVQSLPETTAAEEAGTVPSDWQVAPKDLVASLKAGRLPHLTWGRTIVGGVVAFWFLFGLAGIYAVFTGRVLTAPVGADEAASGIAVVPFSVTGSDLEVWREGMADLFTTSLDGVGGLHTIATRTVMSRWSQEVAEGEVPDLDKVLTVAGATGARYALVGSAVSVASDVRLSAEIYDLASGDEIGRARVEGPPDSVLALVDRLSVDLARVLLPETGEAIISESRIASITTESLPALQAYLEGEAAYRRSDLPAAVEAYRTAVAEDSLFALARWRLATASSWSDGYDFWAIDADQLNAAAALSDRLPSRDADILEAFQAFERGDREALDLARTITERYPDDPDAWYTLGEVFVHSRRAVLEDRAEGVAALQRAVELDPTFAPFRVHLIEYAIAENDTAGGFRELGEYERLAGPGALAYLRVGTEVFLGTSDQRSAAISSLDSMPTTITRSLLSQLDWTSDDLAAQYAMFERAAARGRRGGQGAPPAFFVAWLLEQLIAQGMADSALAALADAPPELRLGEAWVFHRTVRPLEGDQLAWLNEDNCQEDSRFGDDCAESSAVAAADRGDWETHTARLEAFAAAAEGFREAGRDEVAGIVEGIRAGIEGYGLVRRGQVQEGIRLMESAQGQKFGPDHFVRLWLAEAHAEAGQLEQAVPYFRSLWLNRFKSYGAYRLGGIYEELGEPDLARESYRSFLRMWEHADPDLPQIGEAQAALARLGG